MQKQKFDEIVSYFNKKVSEMEIETKYKMELLGMVTALGYAHEKETHGERIMVSLTAVSKLPPAQPERKKGEWIPSFNGRFTGGAYWFHCSKCERVVPDVRNGGWNFCPNCGADMREDGE